MTNGTYIVRLHFAEIYDGVAFVGGRVFDVSIEGQPVLTSYDVFADAGYLTATSHTFVTTVSDGQLGITLHRVVENPTISGLEIAPASAFRSARKASTSGAFLHRA